MARSKLIYLVMTVDGDFFTFTVKHELKAWITRVHPSIDFIFRMDDGSGGYRSDIEYHDLFPEETDG